MSQWGGCAGVRVLWCYEVMAGGGQWEDGKRPPHLEFQNVDFCALFCCPASSPHPVQPGTRRRQPCHAAGHVPIPRPRPRRHELSTAAHDPPAATPPTHARPRCPVRPAPAPAQLPSLRLRPSSSRGGDEHLATRCGPASCWSELGHTCLAVARCDTQWECRGALIPCTVIPCDGAGIEEEKEECDAR